MIFLRNFSENHAVFGKSVLRKGLPKLTLAVYFGYTFILAAKLQRPNYRGKVGQEDY